jgi:hypothetical protein
MLRPLCFALALAILGCAWPGSIPVVLTEYWTDEDFASYRSYAWWPDGADHQQTQPADHRLHDRIRSAIDRTLAQKGFARSGVSQADFLVTYHCKIAEQLKVEVIDKVWYDAGEGGWEDVTPRVELSTFEEGSIVIDFATPRKHKRVWRGIARGRLSPEATGDQLDRIVDRSVSEILAEFPPPRS